MTGDNVPPSRQNYGGVKDGGPWFFGMFCATKGVLLLFKVDRRKAAILGAIIAANVQPGTIIIDELTAYNCIPNLVDANGAMHQSVLGDKNYGEALKKENKRKTSPV